LQQCRVEGGGSRDGWKWGAITPHLSQPKIAIAECRGTRRAALHTSKEDELLFTKAFMPLKQDNLNVFVPWQDRAWWNTQHFQKQLVAV